MKEKLRKGKERWEGPYQIRMLLEGCRSEKIKRPPDAGSVYLVTEKRWRGPDPSRNSLPIYLGGITGKSDRFRTRIGDFLADAFGFYCEHDSKTGHHCGGRRLHEETDLNPLDLYIAWINKTECHRCLEIRLYEALCPQLNKNRPSRCKKDRRTAEKCQK